MAAFQGADSGTMRMAVPHCSAPPLRVAASQRQRRLGPLCPKHLSHHSALLPSLGELAKPGLERQVYNPHSGVSTNGLPTSLTRKGNKVQECSRDVGSEIASGLHEQILLLRRAVQFCTGSQHIALSCTSCDFWHTAQAILLLLMQEGPHEGLSPDGPRQCFSTDFGKPTLPSVKRRDCGQGGSTVWLVSLV